MGAGLGLPSHRGILMSFLARSDEGGGGCVMKTDDPRPALFIFLLEESHNGGGRWGRTCQVPGCLLLWHNGSPAAAGTLILSPSLLPPLLPPLTLVLPLLSFPPSFLLGQGPSPFSAFLSSSFLPSLRSAALPSHFSFSLPFFTPSLPDSDI